MDFWNEVVFSGTEITWGQIVTLLGWMVGAMLLGKEGVHETVTSQVQLILSRDLAREVIKDLNLTENPEFNAALRESSPPWVRVWPRC